MSRGSRYAGRPCVPPQVAYEDSQLKSLYTLGQEPLLAAIAVCCADEDSLHAMGASDLLMQQAAAETRASATEPKTTGKHISSVSFIIGDSISAGEVSRLVEAT